jgi:hypothetical protein
LSGSYERLPRAALEPVSRCDARSLLALGRSCEQTHADELREPRQSFGRAAIEIEQH